MCLRFIFQFSLLGSPAGLLVSKMGKLLIIFPLFLRFLSFSYQLKNDRYVLEPADPPFGSRAYWAHLTLEELEDRKTLLAIYVLKLSPLYVRDLFPMR